MTVGESGGGTEPNVSENCLAISQPSRRAKPSKWLVAHVRLTTIFEEVHELVLVGKKDPVAAVNAELDLRGGKPRCRCRHCC